MYTFFFEKVEWHARRKSLFIALLLASTLEGEEAVKKWNYRDLASMSPMWMARPLASITRLKLSA